MTSPTLSIIMPIYNAEMHLEKSIYSVLQQSYQDFELILVDDGSVDGSAKLCKEFVSKDYRVHYYHKDNGGAASAKNYGLRQAIGKYCEFIDSDDYLDSDYISELMGGMKEFSPDLCVGNIRFREGENGASYSTRLNAGFFSVQEYLVNYSEYMPYAIIGAPYNKIFSMSIIREHNLVFNEELSNNEDTHFNYDYLIHCNSVFVADNSFYNYINWGTGSLSHRYIPNLLEICLSTYRKAEITLRELGSYEINEQFCKHYFLRQIINVFCNIVEYSPDRMKEKIAKIESVILDDDTRLILFETKLKKLGLLESFVYLLVYRKHNFMLYLCFVTRKYKTRIKHCLRI